MFSVELHHLSPLLVELMERWRLRVAPLPLLCVPPHSALSHITPFVILFCLQAAVNGDTPPAEGLSENDSGVELTNENSPLTAAEPPSPFSPKQNGDAASPQGNSRHLSLHRHLFHVRPLF